MGYPSLELQILSYLKSKEAAGAKGVDLQQIRNKTYNFRTYNSHRALTKTTEDNNAFVKAEIISAHWIDLFKTQSLPISSAEGNVDKFFHSLSRIDEDATFSGKDTSYNINEMTLEEAFDKAKGKLIGFDTDKVDFNNLETFQKLPVEIRVLMECLIRDSIIGPPRVGTVETDWNSPFQGTLPLQASNREQINRVLLNAQGVRLTLNNLNEKETEELQNHLKDYKFYIGRPAGTGVDEETEQAAQSARNAFGVNDNKALLAKFKTKPPEPPLPEVTKNTSVNARPGGKVRISPDVLDFKGIDGQHVGISIESTRGGKVINEDGSNFVWSSFSPSNPLKDQKVFFQPDGTDKDAGFSFRIISKKSDTVGISSAWQIFNVQVSNDAKTEVDASKETTSKTKKETKTEKKPNDKGTSKPPDTANKAQTNTKTSPTNDFETEAASKARTAAGITKNVAGTNYPEYSNTIAAQFKLRRFDSTLAIDGFWGPKTQAAFDKWKAGAAAGAKLLADGEVNKYGVIFDTEFASDYSKEGKTKEQVKKIQAFLKVSPTGNYDAATVAKVKDFQQRNGLVADGIWGPLTTAKAMTLSTGKFDGF